MLFDEIGFVDKGLYVTGLRWSPVYLLAGERSILFEAGLTCAAKVYEEEIRSLLAGSRPETLFLTHMHWDHCGAAGILKHAFPGLQIAASARAAAILKRPNAISLIADLEKKVIPLLPANEVDVSKLIDEPFTPFDVDILLEDGQVIRVDNETTVRVIATPGHTRDHLSYYIPERKILFATESGGCLDRAGTSIVQFLVDYDQYVESLNRLAALPVEILCQGHHFVFTGEETVKAFFARSMQAARDFKLRVEGLLRAEGEDVEAVVRQIKAEQYDSNPYVKQMESAYLLNLTTQVKHLAAKSKGEF